MNLIYYIRNLNIFLLIAIFIVLITSLCKESEVKRYVENYRYIHPDYFIGSGIGVHKEQEEAEKNAKILALGNLATAIRQEIYSVSERFSESTNDRNKINEIRRFTRKVLASSSIWLPSDLEPRCHDIWKDNNGYHVVMIAEISRKKYANEWRAHLSAKSISEVINEFVDMFVKVE